tara:strand:+ start:156 stop:299 length:144 start_codon:yes stop_codon:yes gene_type:complete
MFGYIMSGLGIYYAGFYAYMVYLFRPVKLLENKNKNKNNNKNEYKEL